jgi:hypothetical protein
MRFWRRRVVLGRLPDQAKAIQSFGFAQDSGFAYTPACGSKVRAFRPGFCGPAEAVPFRGLWLS